MKHLFVPKKLTIKTDYEKISTGFSEDIFRIAFCGKSGKTQGLIDRRHAVKLMRDISRNGSERIVNCIRDYSTRGNYSENKAKTEREILRIATIFQRLKPSKYISFKFTEKQE